MINFAFMKLFWTCSLCPSSCSLLCAFAHTSPLPATRCTSYCGTEVGTSPPPVTAAARAQLALSQSAGSNPTPSPFAFSPPCYVLYVVLCSYFNIHISFHQSLVNQYLDFPQFKALKNQYSFHALNLNMIVFQYFNPSL